MEFSGLGELVVAHLMPSVRHGRSQLLDLAVATSPKNGKA